MPLEATKGEVGPASGCGVSRRGASFKTPESASLTFNVTETVFVELEVSTVGGETFTEVIVGATMSGLDVTLKVLGHALFHGFDPKPVGT